MSPGYDPQTELFSVTAREQCDNFSTAPQTTEAGHAHYGSAYFPADDTEPFWGTLRAIDPRTGEKMWWFLYLWPSWSGVRSTAGKMMFFGDSEGDFVALDAATSKVLWHFQTGGAVYAAPMAFAVNGKEYVAIAAGSGFLGLECVERFSGFDLHIVSASRIIIFLF
jgi:alcohol dehydrogenase (cytochrome c)